MSKYLILFQIARSVYIYVLRDLVVTAVQATENDLDDHLLDALDSLFNFEGN